MARGSLAGLPSVMREVTAPPIGHAVSRNHHPAILTLSHAVIRRRFLFPDFGR